MKSNFAIAVSLLALVGVLAFAGANFPTAGSYVSIIDVNAGAATDLNGNRMLKELASQLSRSQPFELEANLKADFFHQPLQLSGRYCQLGQGSGKSRLEFSYGSQDAPATILQICDGQFYYRYQSNEGEANLQFADLSKVASSDERSLIADRATWMAAGGLSSLLSHLADNFTFENAREATIGNSQGYLLRGVWDENRLRRFMFGQINQSLISDRIQWERLPAHLPERIEVVLRKEADLNLFPHRVTFFRQDEKQQELKPVVALELGDLIFHQDIPEEVFRIRSGSMELNDITSELVDRVKGLTYAVRSAELDLDGSIQQR